MQTAIIGGILGFGMLAWFWLRQRQAAREHDELRTRQAAEIAELAARKAELEIKESADRARKDAGPDFTTLR